MTNREWVALHILWWAVSWHSFLWPTACEWHCTFSERQFHHIFSYDQQQAVSNKYILWNAVSSHLFLWPTGSECHSTFCERQSHHIFSYDHQGVSNIPHFVKGRLITSFPMTNSLWVTLHLWNRHSSHLFPMTNREWVTLHILWKAISSYDTREWVTLHILWKAISSHPFLWRTGCE